MKSGTVEGICEPIGHADQVRAEGSHVIRHLDRFHRFFNDVPDKGIVLRAGNLNAGAWKKMENEWADRIAYGKANNKRIEIKVNVEIDPPGAVRPDHFYGDYTVYEVHPDGSQTVLRTQPIDMANEPARLSIGLF